MADDYNENDLEQLRRDALEARQHLTEAEQTASELPPLFGVEDERKCSRCGHTTFVVARYADGHERPVCMDCAMKEMDEHEQRKREQRKRG